MRIDLHAHSLRSDGTDTPTELLETAKAAGLAVVAITDHDNTDGWTEAVEAALRVDIGLVKGAEMTTDHDGNTVHLLGYEFKAENAALMAEFARAREMREERVDKILTRLNGLGKGITREDVEAAAGGAPIGKPHFHMALVAKKLVPEGPTYKELLKGGDAYVKRTYAADLTDAVKMIAQADGKAVIGHPWGRGGKSVLTRDVLRGLKDVGLAGIEANHPDHSDEDRQELSRIAQELDLVVTGGSDYHGQNKELPKYALGSCTTDEDQFQRLLGRSAQQ